jgi:hypothetical protein
MQFELVASSEINATVGKCSQPQFWTLQICEDTDRTPHFLFDLANGLASLSVIFVRAMTKIKSEHIGTCFE